MSQLNELKLVAVKKPRHIPAVQVKRNKLSSRLWEQIQLARSQVDGTEFKVMKNRTFKDRETGLSKQMSVPKRLKPWWFVADDGRICVSIRYGSQILELAESKHSVEVESATDLINALEVIKSAVEAGDLDVQIDLASKRLRGGFSR